jgi:hypothetical protein
MKVLFIEHSSRAGNCAVLETEIIDSKTINLWHSNDDDGYYSYEFNVEGTEEEIKIIKEFCEKITKAK